MQLTHVVARYLCGNYNCSSYLLAVKISFLDTTFSDAIIHRVARHKCQECKNELDPISIEGELV